jgi:hypothetical protein
MKALVIAAATIVMASTLYANAQSAGPTYSDTIHQSAGDRDSRGTPKYYQHARISKRHHRSTTGAGGVSGQGPYYSNTIHQSAGDRDSRGNPKYYKQ